MKNLLVFYCIVLIVPLAFTERVFARNTILTGGLAVTYDFQDRDEDEDNATSLVDDDDDDYSRLIISPLIQIVSSSPRDNITFRVEPGVNYDLDESETDFDQNFFLAADRAITRNWRVEISERFFRADYDDTREDREAISPELSEDTGRRRFYRNTLDIGSDYFYGADSLVNFGASWIILRNDDDNDEIDEYDRYSANLRNEHRISVRWKTLAELEVVRGDYDDEDSAELSDDVYEYYAQLGIENNSFVHNPITFQYDYIGTRYDEDSRDYNDIHELRLTWRRDFSTQFYTVVGAGPSYNKTESRDGEWSTNAIVEANYQVQRGSYRFFVEKGIEPQNFDGSDETGIVDFWDAEFYFQRQLTRVLSLDGRLAYYREEREDLAAGPGADEIDEDEYTARIGLAYNFLQYYTARVDYTYFTQDSDDPGDNYDDHRVVVSFSWERDLMRW